jgi:hypothetical protein
VNLLTNLSALITASSQGEKGHAALLMILGAISAKVVDDAVLLISFIRAKIDKNGNVKDLDMLANVQKVIDALILAARATK